jgi:hypothetical protein
MRVLALLLALRVGALAYGQSGGSAAARLEGGRRGHRAHK